MKILNKLSKRISAVFLLPSLLLMLNACSKTNQSFLKQGYHNLTAHYNSYFNANELFKTSLNEIEKQPSDDYSAMLNIYPYENKAAQGIIAPNLEPIVKKASFAIQAHEISRWSDDSYLLMGKTHFINQDYTKALDHFSYITAEYANGFKSDLVKKSKKKKKKKKSKKKGEEEEIESVLKHNPAKNQAMLWMARSYTRLKKFDEASTVLSYIEADKKFPKNRKAEFYLAKAENYLMQNENYLAQDNIQKALELTKKKKSKARPSFILAQLYEADSKYDDAINTYRQVIKLSPDYEMVFHAKLKVAELSAKSGSGGDEGLKILSKMSKEAKNAERLDEIYYLKGLIYSNQNNVAAAVEAFQKSIDKSSGNQKQLALSHLALAEVYYNHEDYYPSGFQYDSTLSLINVDFNNYNQVKDRSDYLSKLIEQQDIINYQDSINALAQLPEKERKKKVYDLIYEREKALEKEKRKEEAKASTMTDAKTDAPIGLASSTTKINANSKWYFYNESAMTKGANAFKKKWGNIKLTDYWGLSSKASKAADALADNLETPSNFAYAEEAESFLKSLPTTEAQKKESEDKSVEAYYILGSIYKSDIQNYPLAASTFENLLKKYPDNKYKAETYYQLYLTYTAMNQRDKAQRYKSSILNEFPGSTFAKAISDPQFLASLNNKTNGAELLYNQAYLDYGNSKYQNVIDKNIESKTKFAGNDFAEQFEYLSCVSLIQLGKYDEGKNALNSFISKTTNDDLRTKAQEVLMYLSDMNRYAKEESEYKNILAIKKEQADARKNMSVTKDENSLESIKSDSITAEDVIEVAKPDIPDGIDIAQFSNEVNDKYRLVILPDSVGMVTTELMNNLKKFNSKNGAYKSLKVASSLIQDDQKIVNIREFKDQESAMTYLTELAKSNETLSDEFKNKSKIFILSSSNYSLAMDKKAFKDAYYFFKSKNP